MRIYLFKPTKKKQNRTVLMVHQHQLQFNDFFWRCPFKNVITTFFCRQQSQLVIQTQGKQKKTFYCAIKLWIIWLRICKHFKWELFFLHAQTRSHKAICWQASLFTIFLNFKKIWCFTLTHIAYNNKLCVEGCKTPIKFFRVLQYCGNLNNLVVVVV